MERRHRKLIQVALAACVVWLVVGGVRERLTSERRLYAALDMEVQVLRQPGDPRVALAVGERERYFALLRSRDQISRWRAAADVSRLGDGSFVPALVAAMQDDDGTRRTCLMAQSLGAIGDPAAVPALLEAIHHPRNLDLRVCATHALAEIDDARAVAPLVAKAENGTLRDDDRVAAILALGDLARPAAISGLRRLAASERFHPITLAALRQIALLQADDPVPGLVDALNSPRDGVSRRWLIRQLEERWDSRVAAALHRFLRRPDGWRRDRIQALACLLHHHSLERALLQELTVSSRPDDRGFAAYVQRARADAVPPNQLARYDVESVTTLNSSPR